mgnify:CR=1 FL=1
MADKGEELGEILLEQRRVGSYLRVTAVCAQSGLEVVFIAPADAGQALISAVASAKVAHVRAKLEAGDVRQDAAPRSSRGVVV